MSGTEILVIGGGPAGAACASHLAAAGREVLLVERAARAHHKVCGEFLSIETQGELQRLGVNAAALGAVAIDHVAVHAPGKSAGADLPFRALSLSRYRLDAALLSRAADYGVEVRRGVSVQQVTRDGAGWRIRCDGGETIECRQLVLATGKWSVRGMADTRDMALVGLKMHLQLSSPTERSLAGRVELALFDGGYAGLELVEDGIANLCLVLTRAAVARLAPGWPPLRDHLRAALPHLGARLANASPLLDKPLAVVCPGAGHLQRETDEAFHIGDRLAHIPPFTGDGLAIALGSAALAAEHIRRGRPAGEYLACARRLAARPVRLASLIASLAAGRVGRAVLMNIAARSPGMIAALTRATRLPLTAH